MTEGNVRKTLAAGFTIIRKRKVKLDIRRVHWVIEQLSPSAADRWVIIRDFKNAYSAKETYLELVKDPAVLEMHPKHNVTT
jgi:hypothetical protein